jgi:hypothetical protein
MSQVFVESISSHGHAGSWRAKGAKYGIEEAALAQLIQLKRVRKLSAEEVAQLEKERDTAAGARSQNYQTRDMRPQPNDSSALIMGTRGNITPGQRAAEVAGQNAQNEQDSGTGGEPPPAAGNAGRSGRSAPKT